VTSTTTGLPDRYRPISQVAPDEQTATGVIRSWRARDRVLNRDVALRVHTPGGPPAREWITRALTAGGLATPALSMVYDAAEGNGGDGPGGAAYVVNEWLEGQTLRDRLAEGGPLPEREARALVRRLAEGVAEAHRVGLAVGGLTPDHVVLRPGGLAGLLSVPAATGTVQGDIEALGALLELALTGRSGSSGPPPVIASPDLAALVRRARSGDPATGLSSAATMVALLTERPRTGPQDQVRPDALSDSGWMRRMRDRRDVADATGQQPAVPGGDRPVRVDRSTLPPVPGTPGQRPGEAGRWPVADDDAEDLDWGSTFADEDDVADGEGTGPSARRRLALVGLPLLALVIVIAFALWFGKNVLSVAGSVDEVPGSTPSAGTPASSSAAAPPPTAAASRPIPVTAASVFDPYGDGQPENTNRVRLSFDGDPSTSWQTLGYRGSAHFGNLKPGVGVLYDLGSAQSVGAVTLVTELPGTTVEVRTGDAPRGDLDSFPVAVSGKLTGTDQLAFPAPVTARYVLVWVTGLVQADGGFTGGLAEVTPLAAG
jgi:putative peptidoglycan lipid II flippase